MQAQMQAGGPQQPATGFEIQVAGADGDDHLIDIVMRT